MARWQKGIELADHTVELNAQGVPQRVTLRWQASQVLHQDYTVFVQLLDNTNQVVTQVDRQPQQGQWPTSTWRSGDVIEDRIELPLPTVPGSGNWSQVIVGLYDQSGQALEVVGSQPQSYVAILRAE